MVVSTARLHVAPKLVFVSFKIWIYGCFQVQGMEDEANGTLVVERTFLCFKFECALHSRKRSSSAPGRLISGRREVIEPAATRQNMTMQAMFIEYSTYTEKSCPRSNSRVTDSSPNARGKNADRLQLAELRQAVDNIVFAHVAHYMRISADMTWIMQGMGTIRRAGPKLQIWTRSEALQNQVMYNLIDTAGRLQAAHDRSEFLVLLPSSSGLAVCDYLPNKLLGALRQSAAVWCKSTVAQVSLYCLGDALQDDDLPLWFFKGMCAGAVITIKLHRSDGK